MPSKDLKAAVEYKTVIEGKIQSLVQEFAEGRLSREQFQALYERYNAQLSIATQAIISGNPDAVAIADDGLSTIAVKEAYEGKAIGLLIYHVAGKKALESIGKFEAPMNIVLANLKAFSMLIEAEEFVEKRSEKIDPRHWLLYSPGKTTVVVTLFQNEPSQFQIREIDRLQHDFEQANALILARDDIDAQSLAYPFTVFVQKRFNK